MLRNIWNWLVPPLPPVTWEYCIRMLGTDMPTMESLLDDMGKLSWELAGTTNSAAGTWLIFKRPKVLY